MLQLYSPRLLGVLLACLMIPLLATAQVPGSIPGAISKTNLAKPRPKAPVDLTGTWNFITERSNGGFEFRPYPKFKPEAQKLFDMGVKANAEGKAFRDDTGQCFPPGMPKIMTRVWPLQFLQYPTVLIMIHGFENSVRWIYLDGRQHTEPDYLIKSYNGDSIGRWEGDTLVVDTIGFEAKRHWIQSGVPVSDQLHIIERIRLTDNGNTIEDQFTLIDPVNWEGEWVNTKRYKRTEDTDLVEVVCLPDLNEHLTATQSKTNVRE
jgi:hypothetical protein